MRWRSGQPARLPQGFRELWCQELASLSELATLRPPAASLTGSATVVGPEREHWSERLVLIADELTPTPCGTARRRSPRP